jgi:opacity protein-like surface antigen
LRKSVFVFASVLALVAASDAQAQWGEPLGGRLTVSVNGAVQPASQDINRTTTFDLYGEQAEVTTAQEVTGGGLLDIGAMYRVRGNFGIGAAYTMMTSDSTGSISGRLPHPLFFDQPRAFDVAVPTLEHDEQALHVNAVWFIPFVEKVDFAVFAGPSFFAVKQGLARGVTFSENPPEFNTVTIDTVDTATVEESAVGFNIGADGSYAVTPNIAVGVLLRYTRASVDMPLAEGATAEVKAGNFQIGAGVRFRF